MGNYQIVLNSDMGESFGNWHIGPNHLMQYLSAVNLACGFHAGDPNVMQESVLAAKQYGISVGAHPGFRDLQGFGRRMMDLTPEEVYNDTLYQMGALDAFMRVQGMRITHINPHGELDPLVSDSEPHGRAFVQAIKDYQDDMVLVVEEKALIARIAKEEGIRVLRVAYPDLKYAADGSFAIDREKKPLEPQAIVEQSVRMIKNHQGLAIDGSYFDIHPDVLAYHSDVPNAEEILSALRDRLQAEDIDVVGISHYSL